MLYTKSLAAASAVVGVDLLSSETYRIANYPRMIHAIGLTGSTAAGDTAVELFVGNLRIGEFFNSSTGAPQALRDMFNVNAMVGAGEVLVCSVSDAPASNPIFLTLEID